MEKQAGEKLNETVHVVFRLESAEVVRKAAQGGIDLSLAEAVAGKLLAGKEVQGATLPEGNHEGLFFVAVGDSKVGFFTVKRGVFRNKVGDLLIAWPRSEVAAIELEGGVMPTAHFIFHDGTHYALKCPRAELKKLKQAKAMLT